jgi:MFS transporter, ACS family, D-galactonate transporter
VDVGDAKPYNVNPRPRRPWKRLLRDQLMVSLRDRALVEARAAGIDPDRALSGHWRQMLRLDVIGSAFAISVYLFIYYFAVGFLVLYCATVYGYSTSRANALANW